MQVRAQRQRNQRARHERPTLLDRAARRAWRERRRRAVLQEEQQLHERRLVAGALQERQRAREQLVGQPAGLRDAACPISTG